MTSDADAFRAALASGALDRCLLHVRRQHGAGDAERNCRLAEALLHRGRGEEAVECCRRAMPGADDDPALLRVCAWVFSNAAQHEDAAATYCRLVELCPEWSEGHRHASGSLAAIGRLDEAIVHAAAASDGAPQNGEFALHAGSLLLAAQRAGEAEEYLARAVALQPDEARALYALALARAGLGQIGEAAALAGRAALAQGGDEVAIDVAELLMRCDRPEAAAELLRGIATDTAAPRVLRVLSAAEMLQGRLAAALSAIDRALAAMPENAEYHLHRAHLLWRLDDQSGAARALECAAALDPASRDVRRAQMSLYLANGLVTEATAAGGQLLHRFPDDKPAAEAVLHLLNHRLGTIEGDYVVLNDGTARAPRPRRAAPGALDRLRSQRRVIRALIIRETRTRFAEFRLGYGWALLEPILHITLLSVMFAVLMHGRPPIGRHFFIFYYTGLIRYSGADGTNHEAEGVLIAEVKRRS